MRSRLIAGVCDVQDFQFYVTDDRYSVPTLLFVNTRSDETARALARRMLESEHHHRVEVWSDDHKLFCVRETHAAV